MEQYPTPEGKTFRELMDKLWALNWPHRVEVSRQMFLTAIYGMAPASRFVDTLQTPEGTEFSIIIFDCKICYCSKMPRPLEVDLAQWEKDGKH